VQWIANGATRNPPDAAPPPDAGTPDARPVDAQ
jgi:hypothetical protein